MSSAEPRGSTAVVAPQTRDMPAGRRRALHRWFDVGVLFKGAEGLLEVVAGIWLRFDPTILQNLVFRLTAKELLHDPDDRIAGALRHFADDLGSGRTTFAVVYLLAHGVLKVILATALLRNQRWAYPFAIGVLVLFAAYQVYRFTHTHSALLPVLAALDLLIAWLVWREGRARS